MENKNLYNAIYRRKSVRNYDSTPLDQETLNEISDQIKILKPLYEDIRTEFKILSSGDVHRRLMKKAPHYIAGFSEIKENYKTNLGFMMQQMDLFLSANGIGTCWQGIPTISKEVKKGTPLKFIILLAFGKAKEPLYRSDISEFKRKTFQEISNNIESRELIEAARIAPSATNSQPWFFTGNKDIIHAYIVQLGVLKRVLAGKYPPIDMGIALCHIQIAAEHFGKKANLIFDKVARNNSPQNMDYVASLKIE